MSSGGSLMGSSSGVSSCTTPTQMADGRSSFIPSPDVMEDLAPMSRDRCNTWPMRRPNMDLNAQTSPLAQEGIPEEEVDLYDSSENLGRLGASSAVSPNLMHSPDGPTFSPGMSSPVMNGVPHSGASDTSDGGQNIKKSTTRKNAWGNMSYADLITQAIMESPEKRLTLSQVYEWMVQNVSYFRDKGDSNSSAGWKVRDGIYKDFKGLKRRPLGSQHENIIYYGGLEERGLRYLLEMGFLRSGVL